MSFCFLGCSYRAYSVRVAIRLPKDATLYFVYLFPLLFSACFIEPNGRNSLVQPSFDVTVFICVSCLFGLDEF